MWIKNTIDYAIYDYIDSESSYKNRLYGIFGIHFLLSDAGQRIEKWYNIPIQHTYTFNDSS